MAILLAGDIGGTKTILRLVDGAQATLLEETFASPEYPDLVPMVDGFLATARARLGAPLAPRAACFGIAGPVVANACKLTNLSWALEGERLARELEIPQVDLINDFAAVGYGVLGLAPEDLRTLQPGAPDATAPIAVIGAGTGLGQGFLIPDGDRYRVFGSEGGHVDFAPRSGLEFQLLSYLQEAHHLTHVSVERVVSGLGLCAIYQFLRDRDPGRESPRLAEVLRTWKGELGKEVKSVDLAAEVSRAAREDQDYLSLQTLQLFFSAYGAETGNLALKLLPYGGLYVAGGIAAKNLVLLQESGFLDAFRDKGRMRPVVERVPLHVVLNPRVGLIGAARRAAEMAA